jgi:hypothetical protein
VLALLIALAAGVVTVADTRIGGGARLDRLARGRSRSRAIAASPLRLIGGRLSDRHRDAVDWSAAQSGDVTVFPTATHP